MITLFIITVIIIYYFIIWWQANAFIDDYFHQVNTLYKKVEGIILQLSSFDDSCRQIRRWIEETHVRLTLPGAKEGHNQVGTL